MFPCLTHQGSPTNAREGPSTVSSKVQNFTICQTGSVLSPFVADEEQSLDETKDVVRKKLGLGHDAAVQLAQLRDGKRIDLEDGVFILFHSPLRGNTFRFRR